MGVENEGGGGGYDLGKCESMACYVGEHDRNVPEYDEVDRKEPAEVEWEEPAEAELEEPVEAELEEPAEEE